MNTGVPAQYGSPGRCETAYLNKIKYLFAHKIIKKAMNFLLEKHTNCMKINKYYTIIIMMMPTLQFYLGCVIIN